MVLILEASSVLTGSNFYFIGLAMVEKLTHGGSKFITLLVPGSVSIMLEAECSSDSLFLLHGVSKGSEFWLSSLR